MQSNLFFTVIMAAVLSSCNGNKDSNETNAIKDGAFGNEMTSALVRSLMGMEFSLNKDLNLRDGLKEKFTDEINGVKIEYTKYTYTIQNNKIVNHTELVLPVHCSLTAALRADINPDNAILAAKAKLSLNKTQYNGNSQHKNGSVKSSSKLEMALGYGQKTTSTVLYIACSDLTTMDELKAQLGDFISMEKAASN